MPADALVARRFVRAEDPGDEVHRVLSGSEALREHAFGGRETHDRLLRGAALVGPHRRRDVVVRVRHEPRLGVVHESMRGRRRLEVPEPAGRSAKNWLVPRARAASSPRSRASSNVRASRAARRTKTLGTPMRLSLECTELLTLPTPWLFMPSISRYGAPARPMIRVPSDPGEIEEDIVDGVDDVPVHVVPHDVTSAGHDGDGRAVIAGPRRARRRGGGRLLGGELLAAVQNQQMGDGHVGAFGQTLELLDVAGQPAARLRSVGERLTLGLGRTSDGRRSWT